MEDLKISLANDCHKEDLIKIWQECFGDSREYIEFFLSQNFKRIKTVVAIADEKVVGAAYLLPVKSYEYKVLKNGWYGYAIGILPEYRKRGIYAKMHEKIMNGINSKNEFYILCPANEKLASFYASLGFMEYSYLADTKLFPKQEENIEFEDISAKEYELLRNSFFDENGLIIWNEVSLEYAIAENEFCGGFAKKVKTDKKEFALISRVQDNGVKITESTVPKEYMQKITSAICKKYGFEYAIWTRPSYEITDSEKYLCAMSCNLKKEKNAYLNLVLN